AHECEKEVQGIESRGKIPGRRRTQGHGRDHDGNELKSNELCEDDEAARLTPCHAVLPMGAIPSIAYSTFPIGIRIGRSTPTFTYSRTLSIARSGLPVIVKASIAASGTCLFASGISPRFQAAFIPANLRVIGESDAM